MTEEQFTDEQGNIVTKKVGARSPLSWGGAMGQGLKDGRFTPQLLTAALTEG